MDILSDLFRDAGLRRRVLDVLDLPKGQRRVFPCDRSVGLHVIVEGAALLRAKGAPAPIRLEAGDIALMARGQDHALEAASLNCRIVSGAYQLWHAPLHPTFSELPPWFFLRDDPTARLDPIALVVSMLAEEARGDALGRDTAVHALLDVLFTRVVREVVARRGQQQPGLAQAIRDPHVRAALALLHEHSAKDWTLEQLASEVGLSRSTFAERFRESVGEPPLSYLRTLRLQRAMRRLAETGESLDVVARGVGYGDAFAFSKAFKKATGMSPGQFRRRDAESRDALWRFTPRESVGVG